VSIAARRPRLRRAPPSARPAAVEVVEPVAVALAPPRQYIGVVTRALAFAADAAVINAVAIVTAAVVTVTLSVLSMPDALRAVLAAAGGALYLLWSVGYFVTFWATTGQTPGSRLLRIRVCAQGGERLLPRRALLRFGGLMLAAIPLFAGFVPILFDDRRRGLQDWLARTVVIEADEPAADRPRPSARTQARG
jgi:uncharacterized RDD family membrane protein YckC